MSLVTPVPVDDGAIVRLILDAGKGNVLSSPVVAELRAALAATTLAPRLRAVVLEAAGPHFSFGASVEEHLPAHVRDLLAGFHALLRALLTCPVPVVAAVRGQCLGGGLEVALACTRIVAAPDAKLGQPEIRLAVFAPAASALLPERVGQAVADELLLTGRVVAAEEAAHLRLVDEVAADPSAHAVAWARQHLAPLAPSALRTAVRAARGWYAEIMATRIDDLERLYLAEVVPSADALEGLAAFLEKRAPRFQHG